jgi:hypothetical protein
MSNPWTRNGAGTPLVWPYGANGASGDNFSSLPNNAAKCLGVISPGTVTAPFGDVIIPPWKFQLVSSPSVSGGLLTRYIFGSEDDTTPVWPGGISPTSTADQYNSGNGAFGQWLSYDLNAAQAFFDQITIVSGIQTYYTRWRGLRGFFTDGNIPTYLTILCYNTTGYAIAAYSSGNNVTTYCTDTYN